MKFPLLLIYFLLAAPLLLAQETYRDNFSSVSYSNNDGTLNFSGNWNEVNDGNSAANGRIRITGGDLRFEDISRNSQNIFRSVNLSGASSATISFDWQTIGLDGGNDTTSEYMSLQVSTDGVNYTTLNTFHGTQANTFSQNILAYASATTTFRLYNESTWAWGDWESGEYFYIDNFRITASFGARVLVEDVAVEEDVGTATFDISHAGLNTPSSYTVDYVITAGTATQGIDYTVSSGIYTGTLNFNGTSGDTEQITILITDDALLEVSETFTISFSATSDVSVDISDTAIGTINDNESDPNDVRPYEERYAMNIVGNFIMKGNTNLICTANCPGFPTSNNPTVIMGYSNVDGDPSTTNSSSSTITIPVGATVEYAALYWGGVYNSSNSGITNPPPTLNIDEVKLRTPSGSTYNTITADQRNIETSAFSGWNSFMSYADVTSLVQSGGNGNYFVADIALITGSSFTGPYGGWTMVVVYNDSTEKSRNISIWDGFDFFGFGANDSFTVTGLLTPSSGVFESSVGYFGLDGESSSSGDFVSINGSPITNALNPGNNTLNGTISEFGVDVGNRNPNFGYSWGVDIDIFDATGLIPNSATEMDVVLGSSSEGIWGGVFVTSNEIAFPTVASKSFNPTAISQGNESRVTIIVENPANGVNLTNFSLTDNLPTDMVISTTPDATSSSGGTITAIAGGSNFTISGISVLAGNTCSFSFDIVTLKIGNYENTIFPIDTSNDQNIPFAGEYTGELSVFPRTVITNKRITYRVKKE
ncbi:Calx-beta domain-containing protein [uncultured Maribacter sp.]|uniref:DUF7933 domain-containing protein n=1 Tax=uncultured Maribacter sp. TaxID=431308 RepID=UPI0026271C47|nr:Calx-beta domain-containing protein [uncultured Maribacter sp.]